MWDVTNCPGSVLFPGRTEWGMVWGQSLCQIAQRARGAEICSWAKKGRSCNATGQSCHARVGGDLRFNTSEAVCGRASHFRASASPFPASCPIWTSVPILCAPVAPVPASHALPQLTPHPLPTWHLLYSSLLLLLTAPCFVHTSAQWISGELCPIHYLLVYILGGRGMRRGGGRQWCARPQGHLRPSWRWWL